MRIDSRENTLKQEAHAKSDEDGDGVTKEELALFLRFSFSLPYSQANNSLTSIPCVLFQR